MRFAPRSRSATSRSSEELELRVGITTGEALVSLDARPDAGEGMASGDVVNTAARLQSAAPVNGILADETTYRATRGAVDYEQAEPVEAKGKAEPIRVWTAVAAHSRFGVDVAHEARSELVGRERELGVVSDAFERARHERTPQLLTLVGVPGIGKSRLVYELQRLVDADPELITWRQGRCLAYGDGITLWALGEIVKAQAGVLEQDTPEEIAAKIRQTVEDTLAGTGDEARVETHLLALLGLAGEAQLGGDRRNEAFAAWRRFLEGLAEQRPLVVVVEDIHWADESLLDFLDELVDWVTDVPLLVVATARPELLERRPGWGGGKLNATTLALSPLSDEQTAELIGRLLAPARCSRPTRSRRCSSAQAATRSTPSSSSSSTRSRARPTSSRFRRRSRASSPPASTGCPSRRRACCRTQPSSARCSGRARSDGIRTRRPRRSTRSSARASSAASGARRSRARASSHLRTRSCATSRTARFLAPTGRGDTARWPSGSTASAVPRTTPRCSPTTGAPRSSSSGPRVATTTRSSSALGVRCAPRAIARSRSTATPSPSAQYEDALALWPDDAERPELLFRLAVALHRSYDEARQQAALESARDALLAVGDTERASEAESFLARVFWERGQHDLVREHLARAEALAGDSVSTAAARVLAFAGRIREIAGEKDEGRRLAEAAFAMATELGLDELRAHALTTIGMAKNDVDFGSGLADMEHALEIALAADAPVASAIVNNLAIYALFAGDFLRTDELYAEATRLAERYGDASSVRFVRGNHIFIDFILGRWDRALESADTFIAECEAGSPHMLEYLAREVRATLWLARGDPDAALRDQRPGVRAHAGRGTSGSTCSARLQRPRRSTPSSVSSTKRMHSLCRCRRWFARSGCTVR